MDLLKKLFPFSFGTKEAANLIIKIIVYLVVGVVVGVLTWIIGFVPLIGGILSWIIRSISGIYILAGIVIAILNFCKIL